MNFKEQQLHNKHLLLRKITDFSKIKPVNTNMIRTHLNIPLNTTFSYVSELCTLGFITKELDQRNGKNYIYSYIADYEANANAPAQQLVHNKTGLLKRIPTATGYIILGSKHQDRPKFKARGTQYTGESLYGNG